MHLLVYTLNLLGENFKSIIACAIEGSKHCTIDYTKRSLCCHLPTLEKVCM